MDNIDEEINNCFKKIKLYEKEMDEIKNKIENPDYSKENKLKFEKQIDSISASYVAKKICVHLFYILK